MTYFVKITADYSPKNRLQALIKERCQAYDQMAIETPAHFFNLLQDIVHRANGKWPRCRAEACELAEAGKLEPDEQRLYVGRQRGAFGTSSDILIFTIYRVRGVVDPVKREIRPATVQPTTQQVQLFN